MVSGSPGYSLMHLSGFMDFSPSGLRLLCWPQGGGFLQIFLRRANSEGVGERGHLSRLRVLVDSDLDSVVVLAVVVILLWLLSCSLTSLSISFSLPLSLVSFLCLLKSFLCSLGWFLCSLAQHFNRECASVSKLVKCTIVRKYWEILRVHPLFLCVNCVLIARRTRCAQATCAQ